MVQSMVKSITMVKSKTMKNLQRVESLTPRSTGAQTTGPKQTETSSKTAPNGCPKNTLWRVAPSAKHLLSASRQISCKKLCIFALFEFLFQKMLRIGLTCIVWYADAENAIETRIRANVGKIVAISNFQTVASKNPPSVRIEWVSRKCPLEGRTQGKTGPKRVFKKNPLEGRAQGKTIKQAENWPASLAGAGLEAATAAD